MTSIISAPNNIINGLPPAAPQPAKQIDLEMAATKKQELRTKLWSGAWFVEFTKVDGTNAVMECTLDPKLIPERATSTTAGAARPEKPDLLHVYALDREGWRSFRVLNVLNIVPKPDAL